MKRIIIILLLVICYTGKLFATHLMGGSMTYTYIGKNSDGSVRYKVTLKVYRDCLQSQVPFDQDISIGLYENTSNYPLVLTIAATLVSETKVKPPWDVTCPNVPGFCISEGLFEGFFTVPASSDGFYMYYQRCCRNKQINALDSEGQGYYAYIPPTNVKNNSPYFPIVPTPFICVGDTMDVQNITTDADGDSLVYSLEQPFKGGSDNDPVPTPPNNLSWPLPTIGYQSGYSISKPFGNNGLCTINTQTGLCKYVVPQVGNYSIAIEVREYRNGVLIGIVRRDVQLIVGNCEKNNAPKLVNTKLSYTITEGDTICAPIGYTDTSIQTITLKIYGDPIDGTGGLNNLGSLGKYTGDKSKLAAVSGTFCWVTNCKHGRAAPYFITAEANDDGCPQKTTITNIFITVKPFTAKGAIHGDSIVCLGQAGMIYYSDPKNNYQYTWTVNGGTFTGQGTSSITVNWAAPGTGQVILNIKSPAGCQGDPDTMNIVILPPVTVKPITGDTALCEYVLGKVYSVPNTTTSTYSWFVNGGAIISGQGTNSIAVNWGAEGRALVGVIETSDQGCNSDSMLLTVNLYHPHTSPIDGSPSVCPHVNGVDYSVEPTTGSQYYWNVTGGTQMAGGFNNAIKVDWGGQGSGMVAVVEINKYGCLGDTVFFPVQKTYQLAGQVPVGDSVVCAFTAGVGYEVHYTNNSVYTWSVVGGSLVLGQTTSKITVNWGQPGQGYVIVFETSFDSVTGLPCGSIPDTLPVRIAPLPSAKDITGSFDFCETPNPKLFSTKGNPGSTYQWKLDGNVIGSNTDTISYIFDQAGNYTIAVIETTIDSCVGSVIDSQIIVHPNPKTTAIDGDSFICSPNYGAHIYKVSGFPGSTFNWIIRNGTITGGQGTDNIVVDWLGVNPAEVRVIETSQFGCPGDTMKLAVYMDKPSIEITYITVGVVNDRVVEVNWKLNNAPRFNSHFEIYRRTIDSITPTSFALVGQVGKDTFSFTDYNVSVNDSVYQYYVKTYDLCEQSIQSTPHTDILLTGQKVEDYNTMLWWTKYYGWNKGVLNYQVMRQMTEDPIYYVYEPIFDTSTYYTNGFDGYSQCYRIKAIQNNGQYSSWSNKVCFTFDPILWIPNAFTPNEDRMNDLFELKGGSLKHFKITIFNRWGERMFHSEDLNNSWDGYFHGKPSQVDVYVYVVRYWGFDNILQTKTGEIHLLR